MLRSLHVENYVLIDSLDISFPEGLVIITGQTGAGKSILLGALGLLRGAKADASAIAAGADSCVVEAEFDVDNPSVRDILDEAEVEHEGSSCIIIRRVVFPTGRSRAFVNDCPVSVQVLEKISALIIDVHSQHQSLLLSDRAYQLSVLDHFAGTTALCAEVKALWSEMLKTKSELEDVVSRLERLRSERDYNQSQWEQLEAAALREGELEELEAEQKQLSNAEQIREDLGASMEAISPSSDESQPLASYLKEAQRMLERVSRFVPEAGELASRLESARIEVEDIASELESLADGIVLSQDRLDAVDARISVLYQLLQKHSCRTEGELIALREKFNEALFDSTSLEESQHELERIIEKLRASYDAKCAELSSLRRGSAPRLSEEIQSSIRYLELDRAVFKVGVEDSRPGASGKDAVSFLFAANGTLPVDISKCASGGELSRIMLCLKAMMARFASLPTMIFDEIDTGVSGSAASKMGAMICAMGENMQVLAITHLPQVAAKGRAHFLVAKGEDDRGRVVSSLRQLSSDERIMEIARLLSGETITAQAIANAKSLL